MCPESPAEADLPPPDPAAEMERILEQEPTLSDFGFGLADFYKTREEAVVKFREDRERICDSNCLAEFIAARGWLKQFAKLKSFNKRGSSYSLKHVAEHDIGYVSNGVFIAAAIAEGFRVQRIGDSPNAWLNISSAAWEMK
jgi:hypothetical protein